MLFSPFSFFLLFLFSIHVLKVTLDLVLEVFSLFFVILDKGCLVTLISDTFNARLIRLLVLLSDIPLKILSFVKSSCKFALVETLIVARSDTLLAWHSQTR